jgi:hypothetical protein
MRHSAEKEFFAWHENQLRQMDEQGSSAPVRSYAARRTAALVLPLFWGLWRRW